MTARAALVLTALALLAPAAATPAAALAKRPQAEAATARNAATAANALGLALERRAGAGNVALSPWSAWSALTMPFAGAGGRTRVQMAGVLHAKRLDRRTGRAQKALANKLRSDAAASGASLEAANALWGDEQSSFRKPFLELLANDYGAPLQRADFRGDPESARQAVNGWVADRTEQHIPGLFPAGTIGPATRMVLANALYFKAAWLTQFNPDDTSNAAFHAPGGDVQVPTMHRGYAPVRYARVKNAQAVALPYKGQRLSMLIVMPNAGRLAAVQQSLTASRLKRIGAALKPTQLDLSLPRFTVATKLSLKPALSKLGMGRAFSDRAQFPGISRAERLEIQAVEHQVWIEVGEKGTQAAAATGITLGPTAAAPAPKRLDVNRPFLFAVRDDATGALLFMGRVDDPSHAAG